MAVIEDQASSDDTVSSRDGRGGSVEPVTCPKTQRAKGSAHLRVVPRAKDEPRNGSKLADLRMSGSLKLLFPRHDGPLDAVFLNSAGGITGGDRFDLSATVAPKHLCACHPKRRNAFTKPCRIRSGA